VTSPPDRDPEDRTPLERLVPELLKRVIETGTKNLSSDAVRQLVRELKLPKDALNYTFTQLDETKNGVYRILAKEVREILERTNLSEELAKALSLLTLEVKMDVRFKPSEVSISTKVGTTDQPHAANEEDEPTPKARK
jgi:ATP-dependent protease Clp ATPase subunit